jgi:hypothetical protein
METPGLPRFRRSRKLLPVMPLAQQPPTTAPQSSRSLIAWLALALLIGVGHVVPALHFLFVAHHLCAEHGELVDAVLDAAPADAAGADSSERPREGARVPERTAEGASSAAVCISAADAHSHEHCEVFAATRAAAALAPAPCCAQLLPAVEWVSPAGVAGEAHVGIALLHYAPKLAPPALVELA